MAITPFKVIQGHRFWYQSKAHSDYTNLPLILHRFQVMADYMTHFPYRKGGRLTLMPSLSMIRCRYRHK